VLDRLGLEFEDAKLGFLGEVLQQRLKHLACSAEDYFYSLDDAASDTELGPLAKELTVTETYFFRNREQFDALEKVVLPARMEAQASSKTLRLLSAGCASGEEPYSLAITVREAIPDPSWNISINAIDINPLALEKAQRGRYSPWAFRETPPDTQRKWFRPDGRDLTLDETIRTAVKFGAWSLTAENIDFWQSERFDVIFCRNVLMYFSAEQARRVIARFARSLVPGGYLFLGHAETLRGLSDDFHLCHTHGTFYYQRKAPLEPNAPQIVDRTENSYVVLPDSVIPSDAALTDAWVQAIGAASARVEALIPNRAPVRQSIPPLPDTRDLAGIFGLLRSERFSEALTLVQALQKDLRHDPDTLLLEAMLLAHNGHMAEADDACHRLLMIDEMNAGAHYVLALCREGVGDRDGAIDHDQVAIYLDPTFAMPRLHLGLLARRNGNREMARRELTQALTLLKHEDAARLLLFGGGFNRQALIALCGSTLRDCGVS
jgi:chemotaxis protein methyltransferase CheR